MTATMGSQSSLLKEVYEKKGKKMAKSMPPWMNSGKAKEKGEERKAARGDAIHKRLKAMSKGKGKPGEFNGPADGVHTQKVGK